LLVLHAEIWTLPANHARVLLAIAGDPGIRLRDIAATLGITERSACAIVTDLTEAGYAAKQREGRRNRYQIRITATASSSLPPSGPRGRSPASCPWARAWTRRTSPPATPTVSCI
jgi:hypothetical protein